MVVNSLLRFAPPDWAGGDVAWRAFRATQPVNAHSHLIAMLLGTYSAQCLRYDYHNIFFAEYSLCQELLNPFQSRKDSCRLENIKT